MIGLQMQVKVLQRKDIGSCHMQRTLQGTERVTLATRFAGPSKLFETRVHAS
ncbi:hypothetical protein FACS1894129_1370 [Actinomycetota bacterium]|nr:hypothetical protein FACS1894129_1370 [Actinomycetota bacterium]